MKAVLIGGPKDGCIIDVLTSDVIYFYQCKPVGRITSDSLPIKIETPKRISYELDTKCKRYYNGVEWLWRFCFVN